MTILLVLASIATIGTTPVAGAGAYEWEIEAPAVVYTYTTLEPRLDLDGPLGVPLRSRVRTDGGPWSDWSANSWVIDPCPGDLTYDNIVGGADYTELGANYGTTCGEWP